MEIERPKAFNEMKCLAEKLAKDLPHARIDFYDVGGTVYFGEITFFDGSGTTPFNPECWDEKYGKLIKLPFIGGYLVDNQAFKILIQFTGVKSELTDYKFFCFNGEPKLIQIISNRSTDKSIDFFDVSWNRIDGLTGLSSDVHTSANVINPPSSLADMLRCAKLLAQNIPFSRIDFYDINGKAYWGEITFFPTSGFGKFRPDIWNKITGSWIKLPVDNKTKNHNTLI